MASGMHVPDVASTHRSMSSLRAVATSVAIAAAAKSSLLGARNSKRTPSETISMRRRFGFGP